MELVTHAAETAPRPVGNYAQALGDARAEGPVRGVEDLMADDEPVRGRLDHAAGVQAVNTPAQLLLEPVGAVN